MIHLSKLNITYAQKLRKVNASAILPKAGGQSAGESDPIPTKNMDSTR